ncbi:MAG: SDR family NAD(P)-dependent oxidoreductase [Anaerolineales bacterium]|nr:SDR family NAD(P)-dependent oxidoreductase [Anaerolineales bacterium]
MKVLLTGAFGNIGSNTLNTLIDRGHQVTCFDVKTKANKKAAKKLHRKARVVWGDLRNKEDINQAMKDQDIVVHLAFVIPHLSVTGKGSEEFPEWAREINVDGTRNLIDVMKAQSKPPKLLFSSSLHIYGKTHDQPPPRTVDDPPQPIEHYAFHKVECEQMVRESGLQWTIFRLAASMPVRLVLDPGMFEVPLDNRIEFVHNKDVATAIANALEINEVWGKTWLIGGGPDCQYYQREIYESVMDAVGIGMLPEEAFTKEPFPTDWLDTSESQRVLQFQIRTLQNYVEDVKASLGFRRFFVRLFRPFIRSLLLSQSPYWRISQRESTYDFKGKTALITGASSGIGAATAEKLAAEGMHVILTARQHDRLMDILDRIRSKGGDGEVIVADLTDEGQRTHLNQYIDSNFDSVDVLINNAGFAWYGFGEDMPWETAKSMIEVNMASLLRLTTFFLPKMKSRDHGHIINVGSIVGSLPSQGVALYSATKAFVDALTTSLYRELQGTRVNISVVRAGAVATPFFDTVSNAKHSMAIPVERFTIQPEVVANRIWSLIKRPKRVVYVPRFLRVVPWLEISFGWLMDRMGPLLLRYQRRLSREQ